MAIWTIQKSSRSKGWIAENDNEIDEDDDIQSINNDDIINNDIQDEDEIEIDMNPNDIGIMDPEEMDEDIQIQGVPMAENIDNEIMDPEENFDEGIEIMDPEDTSRSQRH